MEIIGLYRAVFCLYCSHTTANDILSVFAVILGVVSRTRHDFLFEKKNITNQSQVRKKKSNPMTVRCSREARTGGVMPTVLLPVLFLLLFLCELHGLYLAVSKKYGSMA